MQLSDFQRDSSDCGDRGNRSRSGRVNGRVDFEIVTLLETTIHVYVFIFESLYVFRRKRARFFSFPKT